MLGKTVETCKKQIALASQAAKLFLAEYPLQALPSHRGYEQLIIILEKQGKINEAISLAEQAKKQKWSGDWEKRIARYKKKLNKQ